jgi:hypothetical protein
MAGYFGGGRSALDILLFIFSYLHLAAARLVSAQSKLCQFLNCDVAVILRPNGRGYRLIGRVLIAVDDDLVSTYCNSK